MLHFHTCFPPQVVYTKQAMCQQNGISVGNGDCDAYDDIDPANHINILNLADEAVQWTNVAYTNSQIEFQLRLVHVHYTPDVEDFLYDCGGILGKFRGLSDGVMDEVHGVRDTWGADVVALLTSSRVSGCGGIACVGPSNSFMFSVTLAPYAVGGTFAHEVRKEREMKNNKPLLQLRKSCFQSNMVFLPICMLCLSLYQVGHNFGCRHDRLNAPTSSPYAYGWHDPDGDFRTVMAYNCPGGCSRIQYFSNTFERYWQDHGKCA